MALIPCPECGRMVSPNAEVCPQCGAPVKQLLINDATTISKGKTAPMSKSKCDSAEEKETLNTISSCPEGKKNNKSLVWILLVLGVVAILITAYIFMRDDDGSSPKQPYYVTYGYKLNKMQSSSTIAPTDAPKSIETQDNIKLHLIGRICSDNNSSMTINNENGEYHFINYTRTIKVHQYNATTGELVVYGYEQYTDKYIGKFEGILTSSKYQGKFTNYKGVECTFDFDVNDHGGSTEPFSASDFEYNAILTDDDGDYTNFRDVNGNIIDKLPTNTNYRLYIDGSRDDGEWWFVRDGLVYNPVDETVKKLSGDDWWIHKSCFTFVE